MIFRQTLTADTEAVHAFSTGTQKCTIMNMGTGDAYVAFDESATVNGANCVLLPDGAYRNFYFPAPIKEVHVISGSTPKIQIDNVG